MGLPPRNERYATLLVVLIGFLLIVPPLSEAGFGFVARAIGFPSILVVCAVAAGDDRRIGRILGGLAALAVVGDWVLLVVQPTLLVVGVRLLFALVISLVIYVLLRRILQAERVSAGSLIGGACVYLLLGLAFASIYGIVEFVQPGSFVQDGRAIADLPGDGRTTGRFQPLVYFSFVTLTTLGYGDVVPSSAFAGILATLEAVTGQLYVAILVAGLVGMHLADRRGDQD